MIKIRNLNFRQTNSDRKGGLAYGNFRKEMARKFKLDTFKNNLKFKFGKYNKGK